MTWLFVRVAITKGTSPTSPEVASGVVVLEYPWSLHDDVQKAMAAMEAQALTTLLSQLDEEMKASL